MGEDGAEAGGPQDGVGVFGGAVVPGHPVGGDAVEHGSGVEGAAFAGCGYFRGFDEFGVADDAAQWAAAGGVGGDGSGDSDEFCFGEWGGAEFGWAAGDPEGVGDGGEFREDLERGVAAADDDDAVAGELVGGVVVGGVELAAAEVADSGDGGDEGGVPGSGGVDDGPCPPRALVGGDEERGGAGDGGIGAVVGDLVDGGGPEHGKLEVLFVVGEVVGNFVSAGWPVEGAFPR